MAQDCSDMAHDGGTATGGWAGRSSGARIIGSSSAPDATSTTSARPACLHVALLRSHHAHARIARIDVERARRAPGVVAVVTGGEVRHLGAHAREPRSWPTCACRRIRSSPTGSCTPPGRRWPPSWRTASTPRATPLDLIAVEYEPLAALPEPEGAVAAGAPRAVPRHRRQSLASRARCATATRRRACRGRGARRVAPRGLPAHLPAWPWSRAPCSPPSTRRRRS